MTKKVLWIVIMTLAVILVIVAYLIDNIFIAFTLGESIIFISMLLTDKIKTNPNEVKIEYANAVISETRRINDLDLKEVIFTENDRKLNIPMEVRKEWLNAGYSVLYFIKTSRYKDRELWFNENNKIR